MSVHMQLRPNYLTDSAYVLFMYRYTHYCNGKVLRYIVPARYWGIIIDICSINTAARKGIQYSLKTMWQLVTVSDFKHPLQAKQAVCWNVAWNVVCVPELQCETKTPMSRRHFTLWFQRDKTCKFPKSVVSTTSLRKRATYLLHQTFSFLFSKHCFVKFLLFI
jgi:hypothetical protein